MLIPPTEAEIVASIRTHRWRQGSVLPSTLHEAVSLRPGVVPARYDDRLVVLSHDCDLVHPKLSGEPWVDVLRMQPVAKLDPMRAHLRNPRWLHLAQQLAGGEPIVLEAHAADRGGLAREALATAPPSVELVIDPRGVREVMDWLARRLDRSAFPDGFVERLAPSRRAFRDLFAAVVDDVRDVYLRLESWDELPLNQAYGVHVRVIVEPEAARDVIRQRRVDRAFYDPLIEQLASIEGIEVRSHQPLVPVQFSLADLAEYARIDFDIDLSYRDNTGPFSA